MDFNGAKIAFIKNNEVLVIQRDNKPGLRYAGMWDLPGGGREANETPFECVAREVYEELGLTLSPESIVWQRIYPSIHNPDTTAYFMVASITSNDLHSITFGNEGQGWKMINIDDFMADTTVIEPLKGRLKDYLESHV